MHTMIPIALLASKRALQGARLDDPVRSDAGRPARAARPEAAGRAKRRRALRPASARAR